MKPEFWQERWEKNQIGFHQTEINPHLQQLWPVLAAPAGAHVFVPLCGKSVDMLWLRAQGYRVTGVEISPLAVEAFFNENNLPFTLHRQAEFFVYEADGLKIFCGDFFAMTREDLDGVQAVYDRASLIALPPEMRVSYASHIQRLVGPQTKTLLVTFVYPQHEMPGPPFSVDASEVQALYGACCAVEQVRDVDILGQEPRFRERGVSSLHEKVYVLTYNQDLHC